MTKMNYFNLTRYENTTIYDNLLYSDVYRCYCTLIGYRVKINNIYRVSKLIHSSTLLVNSALQLTLHENRKQIISTNLIHDDKRFK